MTRNDKYLKAINTKKGKEFWVVQEAVKLSNDIKLRKDKHALKHQFVFTSSSNMISSSLPTEHSRDPMFWVFRRIFDK